MCHLVHKDQLTGDDINTADVLWIHSIEADLFSVEWDPVTQFGLLIDDLGLFHCKGRINNSQLDIASKRPLLLSRHHPGVKLLVQRVHNDIKHNGTTVTLLIIREKFWILKGRQTVKKVIKLCVVCNKLEGMPYSPMVPPDLSFCTSEGPPFCHAGVDFAGLYTRGCNGTEKTYVCLFTCCH